MNENWNFVPGTNGRYKVSDQGRLIALWFFDRSRRKRKYDPPRELKPAPGSGGYINVIDMVYADGSLRAKGMHCLVLEAFVGPRPKPWFEGAHLNGNPADNRVVNLEWVTPKVNGEHRVMHGTTTLRPTRVLEDGTELFQCRKCETWKARDGFNKLYNKKSKCKLESECKDCRREYMRHYMYARAHGLKSAEVAAGIDRAAAKAA